MSTVLVIDDEPQIRRLLAVLLEASDYDVVEASSGKEGLVQAATRLPDAVILDLGLPDISGIEVLKRLREWTQMPVLILSVMDAEQDKVLALDAGADDYVTKPFHGEEVLARLRAIMRRGAAPNDPVAEAGALRMDFGARLAWVGGAPVELSRTEYSLLRVLVQNADKIVTHKQLLAAVWGPNSVEQSQYLRVYISHLRRKLAEKGFSPSFLTTETGIGYRLKRG
jgi:two-component system KDP operon response regulator KdpE